MTTALRLPMRLAAAWRYAVTHRAPPRVDVAARLAPYVDTDHRRTP